MAESTPPIITTLGEPIVDFVATKPGSLQEAPAFMKALGGEGANVAVGLARLGSVSRFVGKVGADAFGRFLLREMENNGVDTGGVVVDKHCRTRLAFVAVGRNGERDFEFWERSPAGEQLVVSDIDRVALRASRIVNIAPLLLPRQPARSTAMEIAEDIKSRGGTVAFDANIRLALWKSADEAKRVLLQMVRRTTLLRLNADEAGFLTGQEKIAPAAERLLALGPDCVAITSGARGSFVKTLTASGSARGFTVQAVDTTGCGDAFFAAFLHTLASTQRHAGELSGEELTSIIRFANAVGALTALKRGGAAAIPTRKIVVRFLTKHGF